MPENRPQVIAVCGLLLLLISALACSVARASVSVCTNASVADGEPNTACGANWVEHPWFEITASELVLVCRGSSLAAGPQTGDAACTDAGGQYVLSKPGSFRSGDLLYEFGSSSGVVFAPWDLSLGGAGGGGASAWDIPDLTPAQWGEVITALLVLFVSVGVVRVIRKNAV